MGEDLSNRLGWLKGMIAKVDRILSGAFLENASVSNGRLRFIGGLLLIDSGGTLTVIGHMNGDGDFVWNGPWALKGNGEITGNVAVTGDLEFLDNGRIRLGNMILSPSSRGGSMSFVGGPEVYASGAELALYSSSTGAYVILNSSVAELHGPGVRWVRVTADNIQMVGLPTVPITSAPSGAFVGAVIADNSGNLRRVVSG